MVRSALRPARYGRSLAVLGAMFHHCSCRVDGVGLGRTHLSGYKPPQCGYHRSPGTRARDVVCSGDVTIVALLLSETTTRPTIDCQTLLALWMSSGWGAPVERRMTFMVCDKFYLLDEAVSWSDWGYLDSSSILSIFSGGCSLVVCFVPDPWNQSRKAELAGRMEKWSKREPC